MSKEIVDFIESLKEWEKNFKIENYDYTKYECEVASIAKAENEKDIDTLVKVWQSRLDNKYFELRHPIYNDVLTRAVYSIQKGRTNVVFFIDKDNKHPWAIFQVAHLIDGCAVQGKILKIFSYWNYYFLDSKSLSLDEKNLRYKDIEVAFALHNDAPQHYVKDVLYAFYVLYKHKLKIKNVSPSNCFFMPSFAQKVEDNKEYVYIYPNMCNNFKYFKDYQEFMLADSLKYKNFYNTKDLSYDLILWLGLPAAAYRTWLEKLQGCALILKEFSKYFKKIKVYVDGNTAYEGQRADFPENKKTFKELVRQTRQIFSNGGGHLGSCDTKIYDIDEDEKNAVKDEAYIAFKSLAGYDYRTKICYCNDCDIVISEGNTTGIVPRISQKATILFIPPDITWAAKFSKHLVSQIQLAGSGDKSKGMNNYHIPPQHIYNLAAEVLEELSKEDKLKIKNLKMHRLFVPEVELVKRQYDLAKALAYDLPLLDENNIEYFKKIGEYFLNKENEVENKNKELQTLKTQIQNLNSNILSLQNENKSLKENFLSPELKEQSLKLSLLEEKVKTKVLKNKILEKDLELRYKDIYENDALKENIKRLEQDLIYIKHSSLNIYTSAKLRVQNHLAYKLGQALILNSKSILGYIKMPYVLSYIKEKHKAEQKAYNEKIFTNPSLKLPPLENYPDYEAALKEKECLTYKLGLALIKADKTWYKGGYIRFCFEVRRLKKEFKKKRNEKKNNVY